MSWVSRLPTMLDQGTWGSRQASWGNNCRLSYGKQSVRSFAHDYQPCFIMNRAVVKPFGANLWVHDAY